MCYIIQLKFNISGESFSLKGWIKDLSKILLSNSWFTLLKIQEEEMNPYYEMQERMKYRSYGALTSGVIMFAITAFFVGSYAYGFYSRTKERQEQWQQIKAQKQERDMESASLIAMGSGSEKGASLDRRCTSNPYAKPASQRYGVPVALIQCIHYKETRCGTGGVQGGYTAYQAVERLKNPDKQRRAIKAIGASMGLDCRSLPSNRVGAMGPFQYIPATWEKSGIDGDGDGILNPFSLADATYTTAKRLRNTKNIKGSWQKAAFAHNHKLSYANEVMACAGL